MTLGHLSDASLAKCVNRVIALTALDLGLSPNEKSEIQAGLMKVIIISWIIGLSCSRVAALQCRLFMQMFSIEQLYKVKELKLTIHFHIIFMAKHSLCIKFLT